MHINEVRNNQFYKFPKWLLTEPYNTLSHKAMLVYMLLWDRLGLSEKNKWYDKDGRVYQIFTNDNIADILGTTKKTIIKAKQELSDLGLLEEVRQGVTKPNLLYVNGSVKITPMKCKNYTHEVKKLHPSKTDNIKTDNNNTDNGVGNNNIYSIKDAVDDIEKYHGRLLNPMELETIDKWFEESNPEMIKLAVENTGLANPQRFVSYADSILANWSRQGIDTVEKRNEFEEKRKSQNTISWKQADKLESGTYQHDLPF